MNRSKLLFLFAAVFSGFMYSFPCGFFSFVPIVSGIVYISYLLYLIDSSVSGRQVFYRTFLFNFIASLVSYNWIVKPFTFLDLNIVIVYILALFGLVFISLYVSLYVAISSLFTYYYSNRRRYFIFPISYILMEGVKSFAFTGFNWNPLGSVWSNFPVFMQFASFIGVLGVGFFTILLFSIPYLIYSKRLSFRYRNFIIFIWSFILSFGIKRLYLTDNLDRNFIVRVVDLKIPQTLVNSNITLKMYNNAAKLFGAKDVDLFVFPESSSFVDITSMDEDVVIWKEQYKNLNNKKSSVILGFNRYDGNKAFNSMGVINRNGAVQIYDKLHLVPFGEYFPFIDKLGFASNGYSFVEGDKVKILSVNGLTIYPLICYEAIFTGFKLPKNIDMFVNISNDAWFGEWGKRQHFNMVKWRAVEYGIPIIRSANYGAYGVGASIISPFGKEISYKSRSVNNEVKDFILPKSAGETFFSKFGFYISYVLPRWFLHCVISLFLMIFIAKVFLKVTKKHVKHF